MVGVEGQHRSWGSGTVGLLHSVAARLLHKGSAIIQGAYLCFAFYLQNSTFQSGRCWVRTSDLCRVKAALSR